MGVVLAIVPYRGAHQAGAKGYWHRGIGMEGRALTALLACRLDELHDIAFRSHRAPRPTATEDRCFVVAKTSESLNIQQHVLHFHIDAEIATYKALENTPADSIIDPRSA